MPKGRTSGLDDRERLANRREEVAALRLKGLTTREISAHVGVSHVTVAADMKILRQQWAEAANQSYEQHVALESARYDAALKVVWDKLLAGDLDAVHAFIRLSDRRAKLLGLDHSDKVNEARMRIEAHQAQMMTGILMAAMGAAGLDPTQQAAMVASVTAQIETVAGEIA